MATSEVSIANRALQKLGAGKIESLEQNHPNARSVSVAYIPVRDSLMRRYAWNFAIRRASVAADETQTLWNSLNRFRKPNDFARLLRDTEAGSGKLNSRTDWQVEGDYIVTSESAPLEFRYLAKITDTSLFDPLFDELLATVIAKEIVEDVTGSLGKRDRLEADVNLILNEAKQANAYENDADQLLEDDWLLARL